MNKTVRDKKPIVHCITNYVTVNDVANAILAIGGSPIMADDLAEVSEIVDISNALVINTGTLNIRTIDSMLQAGYVANKRNIPVILDPVGAGVSELRNDTVFKLLKLINFTAIKGNISELSFCAGNDSFTRGVDSNPSDEKLSSIEIAKAVAEKFHCIAIITGEKDIVCDESHAVEVVNGSTMMKNITGTGCMLTGILGAYIGACEDDKFQAAVNASISMSVAGEISYDKYKDVGTGSLKVGIIDALSQMNDEIISNRGKITNVQC